MPNSDLWQALLLAIDMAQHLIRWAWSPSHQGIPGNERADTLAEKGRQDHPLLTYPSPDKQEMSHTPSPAAPIKGRTQFLFDYHSDMETAVAMTLFNTPSQANSDDQETDDFPTPHSVVSLLLGSPPPAEIAAFNSTLLLVYFSSVSRGEENSQCSWWQLPKPPTQPADGNDLLCHCRFTFIAFSLFRIVVQS